MELELVNTLSESRIFRSKANLDRFSDEQNSNLLYLYSLVLYAMYRNDATKEWVKKYIDKTFSYGNYDSFRHASTDLYVLLYLNKDNKYFDINAYRGFILSLRRGRTDHFFTYMSRLETQLKIKNPIYRGSKRVLSNWDKVDSKKLDDKISALYRDIYHISPVAEILSPLSSLKDQKD